MEEPLDLKLVVSGHEFTVNRKDIIAKSGYFKYIIGEESAYFDEPNRVMFKGKLEGNAFNRKDNTVKGMHFGKNSQESSRVEFKDDLDPVAFGFILDFITKRKIYLRTLSIKFSKTLDIARAMNEKAFFVSLREELLKNWTQLPGFHSVLYMSENVNVRPELMAVILQYVKDAFVNIGKSIMDTENLPVIIPDTGPLTNEYVLHVFDTKESKEFQFHDFSDVDFLFNRGLVWWLFKYKISEWKARQNFIPCMALPYVPERALKDLINVVMKLEPNKNCPILEEQPQNIFKGIRNEIQNSVFQLCSGQFGDKSFVYSFDFERWNWELVSECLQCTELSDRDLIPALRDVVCFSANSDEDFFFIDMPKNHDPNKALDLLSSLSGVMRYGNPDEIPARSIRGPVQYKYFQNCTLQSKHIYCAGQKRTVSCYRPSIAYRLMISRVTVENGDVFFPTISETKMDGPIRGCQLIRIDDLLHGFVCHSTNTGHNLIHLTMQCGKDEKSEEPDSEPESPPECQFVPLLVDQPKTLVPVATSVSTFGILILFLQDGQDLWLANYNLESKSLVPLGFLPPLPESDEAQRESDRIFYYLGFMDRPRKNIAKWSFYNSE